MALNARSRDFWDGRYRRAADSGTTLWGHEPNGWIAEQVIRLLPEPGSALDVGAGEGRNARWLAARGWRVTATDFSPAAVAVLHAGSAGLDLIAVEADATTWVAPAPVDLVVLCYLQLEPDALRAAIARAAESLAPGGTLLGIWHDRADVERGLGGTMTPIIRTTAGETASGARDAGLAVELTGTRDRATDAGPASDVLLVARVPHSGAGAVITGL